MPADRIDTIARAFLSYITTDPGVRAQLAAAAGDDAEYAEIINEHVTAIPPLAASEVPAVRAALQRLAPPTAKGVVEPFETEISSAIGLTRKPKQGGP